MLIPKLKQSTISISEILIYLTIINATKKFVTVFAVGMRKCWNEQCLYY